LGDHSRNANLGVPPKGFFVLKIIFLNIPFRASELKLALLNNKFYSGTYAKAGKNS